MQDQHIYQFIFIWSILCVWHQFNKTVALVNTYKPSNLICKNEETKINTRLEKIIKSCYTSFILIRSRFRVFGCLKNGQSLVILNKNTGTKNLKLFRIKVSNYCFLNRAGSERGNESAEMLKNNPRGWCLTPRPM